MVCFSSSFFFLQVFDFNSRLFTGFKQLVMSILNGLMSLKTTKNRSFMSNLTACQACPVFGQFSTPGSCGCSYCPLDSEITNVGGDGGANGFTCGTCSAGTYFQAQCLSRPAGIQRNIGGSAMNTLSSWSTTVVACKASPPNSIAPGSE